MLKILGRQNTIIAELNTNSDAIFAQLADRRDDVVRFIDNAEDGPRASRPSAATTSRRTSTCSTTSSFELKPTMFQLGKLATNSTPLLADLHAAAPGLNKLAKNLPSFNNGAQQSLTSLGDAAARRQVRARQRERRDRGSQPGEHQGLPRG